MDGDCVNSQLVYGDERANFCRDSARQVGPWVRGALAVGHQQARLDVRVGSVHQQRTRHKQCTDMELCKQTKNVHAICTCRCGAENWKCWFFQSLFRHHILSQFIMSCFGSCVSFSEYPGSAYHQMLEEVRIWKMWHSHKIFNLLSSCDFFITNCVRANNEKGWNITITIDSLKDQGVLRRITECWSPSSTHILTIWLLATCAHSALCINVSHSTPGRATSADTTARYISHKEVLLQRLRSVSHKYSNQFEITAWHVSKTAGMWSSPG